MTFLRQTSYPILFLLLLVPSKGWIDANLFQANTLITLVLALNLFFLRNSFAEYFRDLRNANFLHIDSIIFISLFAHFVMSQSFNIFALSFLIIYVLSRLIWINFNKLEEQTKILNAIIFFGCILIVSVLCGLLEIATLKTNIFSSINTENYPNPIAKFFNHSKGIYYSYNATAYSLAFFYCSLSIIFNDSRYIVFLKRITLLTLFLTQAKFAYFFIISLFFIKVLDKSNKWQVFSALIIIVIAYISVSHLAFGFSNTVFEDEKYYYSVIYQIEDFSIYLSLFSELKYKSIEFLAYIDLLKPDLRDLYVFLGNSEPHNLFISAYFFGGIFFLCALSFLILKALGRAIYHIRKRQNSISIDFYLLFMLFVVESLVWDSYDSLIFLLVLTFVNSDFRYTKVTS